VRGIGNWIPRNESDTWILELSGLRFQLARPDRPDRPDRPAPTRSTWSTRSTW